MFHWDAFVLGPAPECGRGWALGGEAYSLYGLAYPVLVGMLRYAMDV